MKQQYVELTVTGRSLADLKYAIEVIEARYEVDDESIVSVSTTDAYVSDYSTRPATTTVRVETRVAEEGEEVVAP